eukprot:CAMPEP_0169334566 /NCGR_PEP_ID=MMETSP1017-20121227/15858_1 /TAXON_ID=342587 /ORGANISM="Karlodinium micrum, Strain CCMP2283" /LENGTH=84 /DNA_ID=CAMNT_0009429857 /DNA_START=109 /DNA_END=363 /DNA_ORIENTATION=+
MASLSLKLSSTLGERLLGGVVYAACLLACATMSVTSSRRAEVKPAGAPSAQMPLPIRGGGLAIRGGGLPATLAADSYIVIVISV